jgi:hypothetical protein
MKFGFFIADAWVIGFIMLAFLSLSRFIFDAPVEGLEKYSRFGLLIRRLGVALIWPIAMISGGGRRTILYIMKGE